MARRQRRLSSGGRSSRASASRQDAVAIERWSDAGARPALRISVSVDNNHCHRYAICQQEAPHVFQLTTDGRLAYDASPDPVHQHAVRQAARVCPMQAITIEERTT